MNEPLPQALQQVQWLALLPLTDSRLAVWRAVVGPCGKWRLRSKPPSGRDEPEACGAWHALRAAVRAATAGHVPDIHRPHSPLHFWRVYGEVYHTATEVLTRDAVKRS